MQKQSGKIWIMALIATIVIGLVVFFILGLFRDKNLKPQPETTSSTGEVLSIPEEILSNKFGFLGGGPENTEFITTVGAKWARPHPGSFLWDSMQKTAGAEIDFSQTDEIVKSYQKNNIGLLITLWPFAEWDQETRSDASNCAVSENDEFLPKNNKKERYDYLPLYRCGPTDWQSYQNWIEKIVERYNGDGVKDMNGLKYPIKHWEIMNEPDLEVDVNGRLVFWRDTPENYANLLIKTYQFIKDIDNDAKVLIAGAAGGSDKFLDFYKTVLVDDQAKESFDIGNVHCISNDDYQDFNVKSYKTMLDEFDIDVPIWVTEAQAMITNDADANATQTASSVESALKNGAEKIFFTNFDFKPFQQDIKNTNVISVDINSDFINKSTTEIYKIIIGQNK